MTMHKALYMRDDIDRLYVSGKKKAEDSAAPGIALMHQCRDSRNTLKG